MEQRRRKKMKKSTIIKIVAGIVIASGILTGVVIYLKNRVKNEFAKTSESNIKTATVESGSISTTVYGTGRLADDDVETQNWGGHHTNIPEHEHQPGPAPICLDHSEILGSKDLSGPDNRSLQWEAPQDTCFHWVV